MIPVVIPTVTIISDMRNTEIQRDREIERQREMKRDERETKRDERETKERRKRDAWETI